MILGQICSSAELSPVVHCYAALSHTWLDSPLVLSLSTPNTSVLSPFLLPLSLCHLFLPIFTSQQYACILHSRVLVPPLPSPLSPLSLTVSSPPYPPLCSSPGSSGSAACRKLRALDLTVCLVSSFDKNHSKVCARTNSLGVFLLLVCCILCEVMQDNLHAFSVITNVNMHTYSKQAVFPLPVDSDGLS